MIIYYSVGVLSRAREAAETSRKLTYQLAKLAVFIKDNVYSKISLHKLVCLLDHESTLEHHSINNISTIYLDQSSDLDHDSDNAKVIMSSSINRVIARADVGLQKDAV